MLFACTFMPMSIAIASVTYNFIQYPLWILMFTLALLWSCLTTTYEHAPNTPVEGVYDKRQIELDTYMQCYAVTARGLTRCFLRVFHVLFPVIMCICIHWFGLFSWYGLIVLILWTIAESENIRKNVEVFNHSDIDDATYFVTKPTVLFRYIESNYSMNDIHVICLELQKTVIYNEQTNPSGMCTFEDMNSAYTCGRFVCDHVYVFVYTFYKYVLSWNFIACTVFHISGMVVFASFLMNACMIIDFYFMRALHLVYLIYAFISVISVMIYIVIRCVWNSCFRSSLWLMTVLFVCTSCIQFVHKHDIFHDTKFSKDTVFIGCDKQVTLMVNGNRSCWHADNHTFETNDILSFVSVVKHFPRGYWVNDGNVYDKYTVSGIQFNEHGECPIWNIPENGTHIQCNTTELKCNLFEKSVEPVWDMIADDMKNWRNRFNPRSSKFETDDLDDVVNQLIFFVNETVGIMPSEWLTNTTVYYTHEAVSWAIISNYSLF